MKSAEEYILNADRGEVMDTVYAITSGKIILPFLVQRTRKEAIEEAVKHFGMSWDSIKSRGYEVKKCKIKIEKK